VPAAASAKFQALEAEMAGRLFERRDEIEGLLLALLSRQHILLVGPKGAAKSMMIRMLASSIEGARYFERLLTRFTLPDELFGPVAISALKKDRFSRVTRGYLPEAHFSFLDEIWKANSSILNSLLAIINERLFYNDGEVIHCPLKTLLGASAEVPQEEALSALYDRFLLRYRVRYIAEDGHLLAMMADSRPAVLTTRITLSEIEAACNAVDAVECDRSLLEGIAKIRRRLDGEGVTLSDRRYKESLSVVRARAWLRGRTFATEDDLAVLANVLWDDPASEAMVRGIVLDIANPQDKRAREIMDALQVAFTNLQGLEDPRDRTLAAVEFLSKLRTAKAELKTFRDRLERRGADLAQIAFLIEEADRYEVQVKRDYLDKE
jgi:MoxR-like ATPase